MQGIFTKRSSQLQVRAVLHYAGRLPEQTQIVGRHVVGKFGTEFADLRLWREPPHLRFANLLRFDLVASGKLDLLDNPDGPLLRRDAAGKVLPELVELGAMEAFVKKYGVFPGLENYYVEGIDSYGDEIVRFADEIDRFDVDAADFTDAQDRLREAWSGDSHAIRWMESNVDALHALPSVKVGGVELTTGNLWSFISTLFLLDHAAGNTAVCANPECPAPYFLRKRKDQKYCSDVCAAPAKRAAKLRSWRKHKEEWPSQRRRRTKISKRRKRR